MVAAILIAMILSACNPLLLLVRQAWTKQCKIMRMEAVWEEGGTFILYVVQLSLTYVIMLLAMTYYLGFFFAIVVGESNLSQTFAAFRMQYVHEKA